MSTPTRLAAFAAALVAVFALAFGVGQAVGPWEDPGPSDAPTAPTAPTDQEHGHDQ